MTYIFVPKPGHSEAEVNDHPSTDNAFIYDYRGSRIIGKPYHATPQLIEALNPKRPEEYNPKNRIVTSQGEQVAWTPLPEGKLGTGENPFVQLIYRSVMVAGESTEDSIVRVLTEKYRVFPMEPWALHEIRDLIKYMHSRALLIKGEEGYKIGMRLDYDQLIDFTEGYDPRLDQVVKFIRGKSTASYGEIHTFLFEDMQWVDREKTVKALIKAWIQLEILTEETPGWYRVAKNPEPYLLSG